MSIVPTSPIEINFNGKNIKFKSKIEKGSIEFFLTLTEFKNLKESISLESIIYQIPAFEDYTIQEVYEVIKELISDKYSLTEESGKYELTLKIIVLKKKKIKFYFRRISKDQRGNNFRTKREKIRKKGRIDKIKRKAF